MNIKTIMKWSGSKNSQAEEISKFFTKNYDTYYEPFCGGCSLLTYLLQSNIQIKHFVASDINNDLISTYKIIQENPKKVSNQYKKLWNELNKDNDIERKKEYYFNIREKFNKTKNPYLFYFIMRTCTNGMPRYNKDGKFNNSFHVTRNGMIPSRVDLMLSSWSYLVRNVEFINCSYQDINPDKKDIVYADPPYFNTKGMYYGIIDFDLLWKWLNNINCFYLLSFDGIADKDYVRKIPIKANHVLIKSGNSSFRRVIGKSKDTTVYESLYVKK